MKKIIALTLVLILAVGLFAGCKSSDKGSELQAGSRQCMAGTCQNVHREDRRYRQGRHRRQRHL